MYSVRQTPVHFMLIINFYDKYSGIPLIYQPPQDITVTESNTAAFNCSVSGQPPLKVKWFKQLPNGTLSPISASGSYSISSSNVSTQNLTSQLSISMVTSMDAGTYVCQANSNKLTFSSTTAVLIVFGKIILSGGLHSHFHSQVATSPYHHKLYHEMRLA